MNILTMKTNSISNQIKQKLVKYDKVILYLSKRMKVPKESLIKIISMPKWFKEFYWFGFDLTQILKKDPEILIKLKKEVLKVPKPKDVINKYKEQYKERIKNLEEQVKWQMN